MAENGGDTKRWMTEALERTRERDDARTEVRRLRAELEGIARQDYRGPRPHEQVLAERALAECHEDIGSGPCGNPAVGTAEDPNHGGTYPVCDEHLRSETRWVT